MRNLRQAVVRSYWVLRERELPELSNVLGCLIARFIHVALVLLGLLFGSTAAGQQQWDFSSAEIRDIDRNQDPLLFEQMFGRKLASRPPTVGGPTVIYYGIEVEEVRAIEAASRRYYIRGFLWTYWRDPRASFEQGTLFGVEPNRRESLSLKWDAKDLHDRKLVWDPGFDFVNADRELEITSGTVEVFPIDPGHNDQPEVEYWCRFSGWFSDQSNVLDFHEFPFDNQRLLIDVATGYGSGQVDFRRCWELSEDDMAQLASRLSHPEWEFDSVDIGVSKESYVSEGSRNFNIGRTSLIVRRKPGFYVMNLGLPIAIIMALFNCLVWIHRTEFEAKLGGIITCLLSLVAFSLVVNAEVPKVPYLTVFGKSILACYCVITFGAAITVLNHVFNAHAARVRRNPVGRRAIALESRVASLGAIGLNIASIAIVFYFLSGWLR